MTIPARKTRQQPTLLINDKQPIIVAQVDGIQLFKTAPRGLWVEEPDNNREEEIQSEENHVCPPANIRDSDRCDLHNHIVEYPIARRRERGAVCPMAQRHDLRGI